MPETPAATPELPAAIQPQKGRTGYVALLGRPNTGKSTFLNTVLGCHLAAVSAKQQTTRKSLLGIYNDADRRTVMVTASRMRKKLEDYTGLDNIIETVYSKGYVLRTK